MRTGDSSSITFRQLFYLKKLLDRTGVATTYEELEKMTSKEAQAKIRSLSWKLKIFKPERKNANRPS